MIGREDKLIMVGGHRIIFEEVGDVIIAAGYVAECIAAKGDDKLLGKRLAVAATVTENWVHSGELMDACSGGLSEIQEDSLD